MAERCGAASVGWVERSANTHPIALQLPGSWVSLRCYPSYEGATIAPSRGALRRGFRSTFTPYNQGAQGMPGAGWQPRSRVQCAQTSAHTSIQVQPEQASIPARWFYGLCRALPGDEFLLPRRRRIERLRRSPVSSQNLRRLDASNGRQNRAALPSAITPFVGARPSLMSRPPCEDCCAPACRGHRSPHPTSVTIAMRPSCRHGWGECAGDFG